MPILERTIATDAPIEEVFAYLADFSNGPEWDPGQESSIARDGGLPVEVRQGGDVLHWATIAGERYTIIPRE